MGVASEDDDQGHKGDQADQDDRAGRVNDQAHQDDRAGRANDQAHQDHRAGRVNDQAHQDHRAGRVNDQADQDDRAGRDNDQADQDDRAGRDNDQADKDDPAGRVNVRVVPDKYGRYIPFPLMLPTSNVLGRTSHRCSVERPTVFVLTPSTDPSRASVADMTFPVVGSLRITLQSESVGEAVFQFS